MRKVEKEMVKAVEQEQTRMVGKNTYILSKPDPKNIRVFLFGNQIASITPEEIVLNHCGWQTVTTKSRINALLQKFAPGFGIAQIKGDWKLYHNQMVIGTFPRGGVKITRHK